MTVFNKIEWRPGRVQHIAKRHGVTPIEVEEVCFGDPLIVRGPGKKRKRLYYIFGQTVTGRYLFVVLKPLGKGRALPITARDMTPTQRQRYLRR